MSENRPVLVTGATGYVGGRLVPELLAKGHRVRAMARKLDKLGCRPWASHPNVTIVQGDVLDPSSLQKAVRDCRAAFYLVHAMIAQKGRYAEADRNGAHNMKTATEKAGLSQIIYLGGLGKATHPDITHHLASRHEVADILMSGKVPVTVLRAAMIIGSGSASFEILRYLVEHLPIMITPRWVRTPTQPIAIENVLGYLIGCLETPDTKGGTFDIGGQNGYYFGNVLWRLRGLLDRWIGGVGLRRGRRDPVKLKVGDALDFWRVLLMESNHRMTLLAEMKVPGEAILDFQLVPLGSNRTELRMTSRFLPRGLGGRLYWAALYIFHVWIFKGMLKEIAAKAGDKRTVTPSVFDPRAEQACALPPATKTHTKNGG